MSTALDHGQLPDNTPIIVGAAQYTQAIDPEGRPPFDSPMQLASHAAQAALADAEISNCAEEIDTIAIIRLFSDAVAAWGCPFGRSDNPPESVARRIGASPTHRLYSNNGGTQPLLMLTEMLQAIARGEKDLVLLAGAEAIANQRFAQRNGFEDDWEENFDLPLDNREYRERFACAEELRSGLTVPVHYYALIENRQAHQVGHNPAQHLRHMAQLLAPFSQVAAANPFAQNRKVYSPAELAEIGPGNFQISLPYSKLLVAQDAVNQAAALILTSAGRARRLGIDTRQWIFVQAYAEGMEECLLYRADPGASPVMEKVLPAALEQAAASPDDMDLIDIYSCFPCAVDAACSILGLPVDGSRALTVTGGLPFFGGPGNNYSMHALAEMAVRLRQCQGRGLVTANGGVLSKHAAAVLANAPAGPGADPVDWAAGNISTFDAAATPSVAVSENPGQGSIVTYTVIKARNGPDTAIVMGETADGLRFLAHTDDPAVSDAMSEHSPIGRPVRLDTEDQLHRFSFMD